MSARGAAFIALWNDVDPALEDEYEAWHTFEHVPERVSNPGFLDGRRYRAAERLTQRYFTLYALASLDALRTERYADVVARPTPWSQRMRPAFRDVRRYACDVVSLAGRGRGGAIGTLVAQIDPASLDTTAMARSLTELVEPDGVVAVMLGAADTTSAFPMATALGAQPVEGSPQVVLVEAIDRAHADACVARVEARWRGRGASIVLRASYDLVFDVARDALGGLDTGRPAPREDLRRRWSAA